MSRVDLAEFVCDGTEDYIQKAVDLAGDFSRLNRLRKGMRSRVFWSGKVLANALEEHYKKFMAAKK
jgi:predicted O-linked N-acetylglucosamine transferase (SPINDLY family)